jgi:hypothetical protein
MARLLPEHAVMTFATRDHAPRRSLEKRALDAVRDAIIARDSTSLDALRGGRLPEDWDPRFSEYLGSMATKIAAWDAQQTAPDPRPGDSVGFVGLGAISKQFEAEQAAAHPRDQQAAPHPGDQETQGFNHGRITAALRLVLKSIAEREQTAKRAPGDEDTVVTPASTVAAPGQATDVTVRIPRQREPDLSERTVDLMSDTRALTPGGPAGDTTVPIRRPGVDPDATGVVNLGALHAARF